MKKRALFATLMLTFTLVSILVVTYSHAQTHASETPAELAFQKIQSLAGEWEGKDELGKAARTVFQSSISRTVIMETLSQSAFPPMMTLYAVDGNDIAIVHYCSANNRPRMKAVPGSGSLKELVFSFIDAGNLPTPETGHEHKLVIRFDDDDHITETWTWHENGQDYVHVFQFSRKARNLRNPPSTEDERPYNDDFAVWSPDGKKIAFMSDRDGDLEIYVANADGTHLRRLTHAPGRDAHPAFSRNGKKIAFQSPRGNRQPQIYVMNANGSKQVRLTDLPGFSGVPDWSPDDRQIIFQSNLNPTLEPSHWQIFVMNSDGSGLKQITQDSYNDQVAKWSPDGSRILFFSDKGGRNQLYTMRPDGSDWQPLFTSTRDDHTGCWSHDGHRVLFTSDAGHGVDIYVFDLRTRLTTQLTVNAPGLGTPFWSPDEKTIAFTFHQGEKSEIRFMDADGSNQRKAHF